jgi:subtilase family serine protease
VGGNRRTIAIVDAYDDSTAEQDLANYRWRYHLPPCTTANGCFKKVNQNGFQGHYPSPDLGWGIEISLDLDMASATCPTCRIMLVEARSATLEALGESVDAAVAKGASAVSNSYGGNETQGYSSHYDHKGVMIVASTGDGGYRAGPEQPATYATVVAVGGTTLTLAGGHFSETAWSDAGSGCSKLVAKPAWQHELGCSKRVEGDISAVADPGTGVAIYYSFTGWIVVGGTSAASPIVASMYVLAGNSASQNAAENLWRTKGAHLHDIVSGSNGTCVHTLICTAEPGYDGPTGWGTPKGLGAL